MLTVTHSTKIRKQIPNGNPTIFDAKGQVVGRLATQIASKLMGKDSAGYSQNLDTADDVVVINATEAVLTGKKDQMKTYTRYSGYPGGMRTIPYIRQKKHNAEFVIRHAVSGMLPKNKLRDARLARLHVFSGSEHPFA